MIHLTFSVAGTTCYHYLQQSDCESKPREHQVTPVAFSFASNRRLFSPFACNSLADAVSFRVRMALSALESLVPSRAE